MSDDEADVEDVEDTLEHRRFRVLYRIDLSSLYHRKRERFYDIADRFGKAAAVVGGSAVFAQALGGYMNWVAALIVLTSTCSLVWSFSERARKHGELARQFCELGADIVRAGEVNLTEPQVSEWEAKCRMLEALEPCSLRALVLICQNQLAPGYKHGQVYPVNRFKRLTAHFIDWDLDKEAAKYVTPRQA